jgi:hypothetical protein
MANQHAWGTERFVGTDFVLSDVVVYAAWSPDVDRVKVKVKQSHYRP